MLQNDESVFRIAATLTPLLFVTVAGVAGPSVEELFFRQFLIGFIERYSRTVMVDLSAFAPLLLQRVFQ
ncbi:CPBP family glutamic-type intramembrane protease [Actinomyces israelii]|uniref:CPBP family glutamic-type intramembrane protease n=1 Tax=Actinomyces israelii TaxID=1659 RepID=UPI0005B85959|nr:CPBP family glutamic-type intramembrane protease [Actinomyces israelii]WKR20396.1 hypothetical protein AIF0345_0273 [Actinomyces israelii]